MLEKRIYMLYKIQNVYVYLLNVKSIDTNQVMNFWLGLKPAPKLLLFDGIYPRPI